MIGEPDKEFEALRRSADPLPIQHRDGSVHWQNDAEADAELAVIEAKEAGEPPAAVEPDGHTLDAARDTVFENSGAYLT